MPLLGFKKRFAPAVESDEKRQTMRAPRKDGRDPKPGDVLYLYTGLRTKKARKLRQATCREVATIEVRRDYLRVGFRTLNSWAERDSFAIADGFGSFDEMIDWMTHEAGCEFPWHGIVVYW